MPTGSDPSAAIRAREEANLWQRSAEGWSEQARPTVWRDAVLPIEDVLIPEADPRADLDRRGRAWGFPIQSADLAELSRFAGALALAESEAWREGDPSVATRAYSDRRLLFADRVLPWTVPWLKAVASSFPTIAAEAEDTCTALLELGEHHRPAPVLVVGEGLQLPGHDGYGPVEEPVEVRNRLRSLWGGMVLFPASTAGERSRRELSIEFGEAASQWEALADAYPGSAGYWRDLAARARRTTAALSGR